MDITSSFLKITESIYSGKVSKESEEVSDEDGEVNKGKVCDEDGEVSNENGVCKKGETLNEDKNFGFIHTILCFILIGVV
jgi:hypothetical protein